MRKTAILIMIFICWGVAAQMLPGDGAAVTVYGIDGEIAESVGGLCDLSGAAVTGETEMRFEHYGDTLVRRIAGGQADWLRVSGDSIWSLGVDTRRENTRYSRGLPYLLPALSADGGDSVHHSVFMSIDRENKIYCRYSSSRGCGFILPGGDTIATTYCVETEVNDSVATVTGRRWYAAGAVWPVVEQITAQVGDEEYTTVNICPPDEQPLSRTASRSVDDRTIPGRGGAYDMLAQFHGSDSDPSRPTGPTADPSYGFTIEGDGIKVTGEGTEDAIARLFDASGRQWHEGPASSTIATSQLPSGVYLLHISSPNATQTIKLTVN